MPTGFEGPNHTTTGPEGGGSKPIHVRLEDEPEAEVVEPTAEAVPAAPPPEIGFEALEREPAPSDPLAAESKRESSAHFSLGHDSEMDRILDEVEREGSLAKLVPEAVSEPETEAETSAPEESAVEEVTAQAEELPESVQKAREQVSEAESKLEGLKQELESTKNRAKEAIDANDMGKAGNLVNEAAGIKTRIKRAENQVRSLRKREAMFKDLLDKGRVQETVEKIQKELGNERDRRSQLQDREPLDDYTEMLKRSHVSKLIEGLSDKYPKIPASAAKELTKMIDEAMKEQPAHKAVDHRRDYLKEIEEEQAAAPEPETESETEDNNVPEEDKKFTEGQDVKVMVAGRFVPGKFAGYSHKTKRGAVVVAVNDEHGTQIWTGNQDLLENWQLAPEDIKADIEQWKKDHGTPEDYNLPEAAYEEFKRVRSDPRTENAFDREGKVREGTFINVSSDPDSRYLLLSLYRLVEASPDGGEPVESEEKILIHKEGVTELFEGTLAGLRKGIEEGRFSIVEPEPAAEDPAAQAERERQRAEIIERDKAVAEERLLSPARIHELRQAFQQELRLMSMDETDLSDGGAEYLKEQVVKDMIDRYQREGEAKVSPEIMGVLLRAMDLPQSAIDELQSRAALLPKNEEEMARLVAEAQQAGSIPPDDQRDRFEELFLRPSEALSKLIPEVDLKGLPRKTVRRLGRLAAAGGRALSTKFF